MVISLGVNKVLEKLYLNIRNFLKKQGIISHLIIIVIKDILSIYDGKFKNSQNKWNRLK